MWRNSRNVFEEQKRYLDQNITKPFNWNMMKYCKRVRELYDCLQYLPPPSMKGDGFIEADWVTLQTAPAEIRISRAIRDGLPEVMQVEFDQKETDYRAMLEAEFFFALQDIEQADIRKRQMMNEVKASEKAI